MSNPNLQQILEQLRRAFFGLEPYRIGVSLGLVVLGVLIVWLVEKAINRRVEDTNRRHVYRKILRYATMATVAIALLFVWIKNLAVLTAVLGFIAAGVAIALRDVIMSLFGWLKILWVHPFGVGDRVEIRDIQGDIIDISPLHTVVIELGNWVESTQSTGRIVYLPNYLIFQEPLFNSTMGFPYLWDEFPMVVTFESDLETAEELIRRPVDEELDIDYRKVSQHIRKLGDRFAIRYENLRPKVYMSIVDSGVKFTLRYLTPTRGRREVRSRVSHRIMKLLSEHPDVELAYTTYRVFRRDREQE